MNKPSYQLRQHQLEEVLDEGILLFQKLHHLEEELREQLIKGDHKALVEAEDRRSTLRQKIAEIEEKRIKIVPEGTGLQSYIKNKIAKSSQERLLEKADAVMEELLEIKALQEVNRSLLEERLRFSKELRDKLSEARLTYDERGEIKEIKRGQSNNIDRSC